ncbi:MAG: phosphonate ABC transporter ATP-binding protein [Verrucomicrobiota bacterium]
MIEQTEMPAIALQGLEKIYPNGTRALRGVDFKVKQDDFIVILGVSGAGKSTLLRCMNRLLEPTHGKVSLNGEDITHVSGRKLRLVRERVGMIFQQFNLVPRLTVLENVLAGRLIHCANPVWHGLSLLRAFPRKEKDIAFDCLRKVHIEELAFQRANTLSGGQQQRVAIARALAQEPLVFLADEPVASLDPASADIVMEILKEIQETSAIPVIVNLHQIELAERFAERIMGMANGQVVFDGTRERLSPEIIEQIYGIMVDRRKCRAAGRRKIAQSAVLTAHATEGEIINENPEPAGRKEVAPVV